MTGRITSPSRPRSSGRRKGRVDLVFLAAIAVALTAFAARAIFDHAAASRAYAERSAVISQCQEHGRTAEARADAAIRARLAELVAFIDDAKLGARPFSRDITSLYGKWRAAKPYLPFTDERGHKRYVEEMFRVHIFSQGEMRAAIQRAIEGSIRDLEEIENDLAVKLRQEIVGHTLTPDESALANAELQRAIESMVAASQHDTWKAAVGLVVSEVASEVGALVLLRLGVSAGVIAVGAANSWYTFGAAFILGLLVDFIWEWVDDPAGDIEREMKFALEGLKARVSAAVRTELGAVVHQRGEVWQAALEEFVP